MARVGSCLEALRAGDSYELCLTTTLRQAGAVCPRELYRTLRALNPAPMAAFLEFGGPQPLQARCVLSVCSRGVQTDGKVMVHAVARDPHGCCAT